MYQILKPIVDILLQVLVFFNKYVNNWGCSIVLLTIVVKIVLLPLAIKQTKSMENMKKWQPEITKLQQKYKNDKEKLGKETMKFYSENKINPLGGCLPLLLQMPIFFALFRLLAHGGPVSSELEGASFLGIYSLTASFSSALHAGQGLIGCAPFVALLLLMMASQYVMQKMMTADPKQEKMMLPMTAVMAVIAYSLPAGLLIYWVVFNILSVAQQYCIVKTLKLDAGV
ncbi:membrane protein insertase YidC [Candidatus Oleimmundimicrobium sp.]|uniref:YidC/Oxa1 family membrane protein insertase n=1 Tax=Candidatus Oleimmundimicrobium sp. TaxID=3060597 RepID=UPI0027167CA2|nr:membrane protein insertase YidC [Candidatus Oleimmundimicrobium sp.]MDO8886386.1 membrane protein insertase YidC [Candidatus Oleimmundimicrobium sp.]